MNFKKWLLEMRNVRYDFSSTQVDVPEELAKRIMDWGKENIPDSILYENDDDRSLGREDEMHVTVLYGVHSAYPNKVKKSLKQTKKAKVKLGKLKAFTNPDKFDVIFVDVESPDLHKINQKLRNEIPFTNKYDEYKPHVTIAYLKKGESQKYVGIDLFKDEEFVCDYIVFSSKDGKKTKINIG